MAFQRVSTECKWARGTPLSKWEYRSRPLPLGSSPLSLTHLRDPSHACAAHGFRQKYLPVPPLFLPDFDKSTSPYPPYFYRISTHLLYLKVRTAVMTYFLTFETESIYKQEKSLEKALFQGILSFYCFQTLLIRKVSINRRNDQIPWKGIISRDFVVLLFPDTFNTHNVFSYFSCF